VGQTGRVSQRIRMAVRVEGIVQGVGFRPFVYALAARLGLGGLVGNDVDGVFAEVEGAPEAVKEFLLSLERDAPPLARIERVTAAPLVPDGCTVFAIAPSEPGGTRRALVSADTATCADCLAELADPADRRYGYPFINCTNCGPRFTIIRDVPYDRPLTTMASFAMCGQCAAEYHDPADRRFHAQPVCCPACGPRLSLLRPDGTVVPGDPLTAAAGLLRRGQVVAVKGLGGYHLAADAASEAAAAALRSRKHREDKPFAVMVADIDAAGRLCEMDAAGAALLASARRPIVLLARRPGAGLAGAGLAGAGLAGAGLAGTVAAAVAPRNRELGLMLPYTPLHHLLLREVAGPIVLTSGNVSDEPIAYTDADALKRLGGIADAFLTHDRGIHVRTDDSVARAVRGRQTLIRRSRGYAPEPLAVRTAFRRPVLACGAELKNTFCLAKEGRAFISQHIGDLENYETLRSFTEGIEHFKRLFDITPDLVAHDLHPDYLSTTYAAGLSGVDLTAVQHHHAHIASCLADNGADGPVIGVAFDGTGYGADGTIWGGEFLVADLAGFERAGHLSPVPMPGGSAAIRQPWRMAAAYLDAAAPGFPAGLVPAGVAPAGLVPAGLVSAGLAPAGLDVARRNEADWDAVIQLARRGVNAPLTSSAGRLFDAVAAIIGVRDVINYEGQAAVELEQLADPAERGSYRARILPGPPLQVAGTDLVLAVVEDLAAGTDPAVVAARFHHGVAAVIEECCTVLRDERGLTVVALSGGVFQNLMLGTEVAARLAARGFEVLVHSRVPCNDGGISLGQAVVAGVRDAARG